MKILWLAHEGSLSGANLCLLEFLEILQDEKHQNFLIVPQEGVLKERAEKIGVKVNIIKFYSWATRINQPPASLKTSIKKKIRNIVAVKQIKELIKSINPDYIATNTIVAPVAAIAAKASGKKHIWFVHEFGEEDHGFIIGGDFHRAASIMNKLSDKLVFNSKALRKKYESIVPDSKVHYFSNAVLIPPASLECLDRKIEGTFRLVLLGQVAPAKNHILAIKALKICHVKKECYSLDIVGKAEDMAYLESLEQLVNVLQLESYVRFTGPVTHPEEVLCNYNALIMCSKREAFGRVTVEALKYGLPVVSANVGGSLEIINDGINGYFYESGSAEDLAEKIMKLKNNYTSFNRLSIAEDALAEFNKEKTKNELLTIFN